MKHKSWYHLINKIIHEWIPQTHQHDKIKANSLVIARHALCSYRSVAEIAKCQVKMVLLLLIFVTTVAAPNGEPTPYTCKWQDQPRDCQSIKILKTRDTYQLTLCLDNVNKCSVNISLNFRCCAICEACETLLTSGCGQGEMHCEKEVDMFLNHYCANTLLDTNLPATHTPLNTTTPTQTSDFSYFQPMTSFPSSFKTCTTNQSRSELRNSIPIIMALGILLGLCVVLLLVVTAGWVCTCRALKTLKCIQRPVKTTQEEQRTAESTDSGDEVEKHVHNPLHEESLSVHDYPPAPRQDTTCTPPSNDERFNQNDAILNVIESGATVPLSAVDDQKEKYLKNPIYEGSLEFQADRYYERENYDCSQDDEDDYIYDALEQGSNPERDTASKRFSDSSSIARHEENEEMSSICDFPVARYDAVSRPCYEEGEDYDVLDHEIHIASSRVAASSFECNKEKYLKNPIYEENPCSDRLTRAQDFQAARAISTLQEDSQDYDILEPESDVMVSTSTPMRYEDKSLKSASYVGGPKTVVTAKPRNLCTARYDTVNLSSHDDGEDYDLLERIHEVNGETRVRDDPYCRKSYSHLDL